MILNKFLHRYLKPAGEADGGGTDVVDRGDDFTPTGEDDGAAAAAALAAAEAKKTADATAAAAAAAAAAAGGEDEDDVDPEDPDAVAAAAAAGKGKPKDTRIPLARHKEILESARVQREALEAKLAQFEKAGAVAATNEEITAAETKLLALEAKYNKLIVDGDHAEATKVMGEIRTTERGIGQARTQLVAAVAESNAYERVRYDTTVERLEAAYPVLNPDDSDNYDKAVVQEVMDLSKAYQATGFTPSKALQKACSVLLGKETAKQEKAVEVTARVDPAEAAKKVAEERRKAQLAKNLEAAGKQPPSMKNVGADSDKAGGTLKAVDAIKLPYAEFVKLPDADLAKLRGDVL